MKRIILSATLVAMTVTVLALSSLASSAQENGGQYALEGAQQYAPSTTPASQSTVICAPWSKAWDLSKGQWVYDWYRWCVDPSLHDPAVEASWYTENGNRVLAEQANLCPEKGTCTITPDGGMRMSTSTNPLDTTKPPITTSPSPTPTATTAPVDTTQPPTSLP